MSIVQDVGCSSSARALRAERALSKQVDAEIRAAARRAAWTVRHAAPLPIAASPTPTTVAAEAPSTERVPFDVDSLRELSERPLLAARLPDADVPLELMQDAEAFIRGDVVGVPNPLDVSILRHGGRAKYREMNKAVRKVTPAGRRTEFTMLIYAGPDADVILIAHERAHKNSYHDNVHKYENWFALLQSTHDA